VPALAGKEPTAPLQARDALSSPNGAASQWAAIHRAVRWKQKLGDGDGKYGPLHTGVSPVRRIAVAGFATVQNDKYLEANDWTLALPATREPSDDADRRLEQWQKAGADLEKKTIALLPRSPQRGYPEVRSSVNSVAQEAQSRAQTDAEALLDGRMPWDEAALAYRPFMRAVAEALSPGMTACAVERRNRIAVTLPDVSPGRPPARRRRGKKGG